MSAWLTVWFPRWPVCFHRAVSLLSCHSLSRDCWLLCQPPQGVSLHASVCMCAPVCVWYRKSRLWSSHFPAAPHVWIEARCFEMLKSQPVHCLAVTHNSPTYSLVQLLFLFSPLPSLRLSFNFAMCIKMGLHCCDCSASKTQRETKVSCSSKLFVKAVEKKKCGRTCCQLLLRRLTFLASVFLLWCCHHKKTQKTWIIKSLCSSLVARTWNFLLNDNVSYVTLPTGTISLGFEWKETWQRGDSLMRTE